MITIKTDMYHHCGPRVAFCAAIKRGSVCALAVERNSASRYSFQVRMSTNRKVAARPGLVKLTQVEPQTSVPIVICVPGPGRPKSGGFLF